MRSKKFNPYVALFIFGFFGGALILSAVYNLYQDEKFEHGALISQAIVKQGWVTTGNKGAVHYHVRYIYRDRYFRQWTVNNYVSQATYARLRVNEVIPVKYLDDETGHSRIDWPEETQNHWRQDEVLLGLGCVMATIGASIFFGTRRRCASSRTWDG